MHITHENFQEITRNVLLFNINLQNYTSSCFGMSDLKRARYAENVVEDLIDVVLESGNSMFMLAQPVMKPLGYDASVHFTEAEFAHITEVQPFDINVKSLDDNFYEQAKAYAEAITDVDAFLAERKYR